MRRLEGHKLDVVAIAFAPVGRWLASAGWDGTIRLWNLDTGQCTRCMLTENERAYDVAFSPDGRFLAAGFRGSEASNQGYGSVAWFPVEPPPGQPPDVLPPGETWHAHRPGTRSVSFSPDGKHLLTCGSDNYGNALLLWDLAEREIVSKISQNSYPFLSARFRPDGGAVAAVCGDPGEGLFVWQRTAKFLFRHKPQLVRFRGDHCSAMAWSPDGHTLVAAFDSGRIVWVDPDDDAQPVVRTSRRGAGRAVAFSPDGRLLLTAGKDGIIQIWDNSALSQITTYDWGIGDVHGVAFAPDGLTAAAAGNETIFLWDVDL